MICASCGEQSPEGARFCLACGAPLAAENAAEGFRKSVTVLFCDVVGSTGLGETLDPETLSRVLSTYFAEVRRVLERHGGSVEKFIGDAAVAVFGLPAAHEDDALRAVKAAIGLRETLAQVNPELEAQWGVTLGIRTALATGTVASSDSTQSVVLGDPGNTAARLQQLAARGEIVLAQATYRLVRDAVEVDPLPQLELKGKAGQATAYRLRRLRPQAEAVRRRLDRALVDRWDELARLEAACREALTSRRCSLVTIVGPAGIGKSRLAHELLRRVDGSARVFRGRCLPYGEGITYWPLAEVVRQAAAITRRDTADDAKRKLARLVAGADDAERIAEHVGRLIGLATGEVPAGEGFWAVRKLLERIATEKPVVVVVDDVQWAEQTLLELIEHLVERSESAPILLLGLTRPELFEVGWHRGAAVASSIVELDALSEQDAAELVSALLGAGGLQREQSRLLARAGEGNPLYVEQLVSMLVDDGVLRRDGDRWLVLGDLSTIAIPPSIEALLVARLELLPPEELHALGRGAVIGQEFSLEALEALVADQVRPRLVGHAASLTQRQLLLEWPSAAGFRFRHLLIRDVAYGHLPKEDRTRLHAQYADWLERARGERVIEVAEILGYHLEASHRLAAELGPLDDRAREIAERAAGWLGSAGRRAFARGDMPAAVALLARAAALLTDEPEKRLELMPELAKARRFSGDRAGAAEDLRETITAAMARGSRRLELLGRVEEASMRLYVDPAVDTQDVLRIGQEAIAAFDEPPDNRGLAAGWALVGHVNWLLCRGADMESAFHHALQHVSRDDPEWSWILRMLALVYFAGPTETTRAITECKEILKLAEGHGAVEISTRTKIAALEAMRGRFDLARELYGRSKEIARELSLLPQLAGVGNYSGPIELLAGDLDAAERELRAACELFEALGESSTLSMSAAFLARALELQGKIDEAERFTELSEATAPRNDLAPQFTWRAVRAKVLARRGLLDAARGLSHDAAALAARTDFLSYHGEVLLDVAEAHRLAGDETASGDAARRALQLFERKGNLVLAARARAHLDEAAFERPS